MKTKILLIVVAVAIVAIAFTFFKRQPAPEKPAPTIAKVSAPAADAPPVEVAPVRTEIVSASTVENLSATPAPEKVSTTPAAKKSAKPKEPIQDPDARAALGLVGVDPAAEAYWLSAISNPSLPDQEREDLMEDLNEDGLSDPKHPGPEDLPLIVNRLVIIEEIAPTADPFMQEHLGEAYKDLKNLLAGKPVQ